MPQLWKLGSFSKWVIWKTHLRPSFNFLTDVLKCCFNIYIHILSAPHDAIKWTHFTVDIDTFVPVSSSIFTRSFAVVLGLICTFRNKVHSSLGDRMRLFPERYDGCVVPWCLYLHTIVCTDERSTFRHLEIAPKDEPDLWRSTVFFLKSSHDVKQRCTEALKYIHRYTSNWLKWYHLAYQKLLKPWHNFLEFWKLFKGTVNLVYVNFWPTGIVIQWIISEIICL